MTDSRCTYSRPTGGTCHLPATIRVAATHSDDWDIRLRGTTITADYCDLHARVVSAHIRAHMPLHWTRLVTTLLSAVDLLPVPSH